MNLFVETIKQTRWFEWFMIGWIVLAIVFSALIDNWYALSVWIVVLVQAFLLFADRVLIKRVIAQRNETYDLALKLTKQAEDRQIVMMDMAEVIRQTIQERTAHERSLH